MVNNTKIALSPQELQLVTDTNWILTKRTIIEKVYQLFGELAVVYEEKVKSYKSSLPVAVVASRPKISRGENYLELPYVVLDYPRQYDKENILGIRTMFWWGNFFSISLHVSGSYKILLEKKILNNQVSFIHQQLYLCVSDDPWQHHFETTNYVLLDTMTTAEKRRIPHEQPFIKVAAKYSLEQWNDIPLTLSNMFEEMLLLLED